MVKITSKNIARANAPELAPTGAPASLSKPYLNDTELRQLLGGICRTTLYNWTTPDNDEFRPDFPEPIHISERRRIWKTAVMLAWVDQQPIGVKPKRSREKAAHSSQSNSVFPNDQQQGVA